MTNGYHMALLANTGIIVKDPTLVYRFTDGDSKRATLITLVHYYCERGTIPEEDGKRMVEMINSPDEENMNVVQTILEQKYKLF